ncbi:MAG: putative toxin-antitoxin system toxin component, PIN family [Lyngbya sp.]|nr:putative toxin-antitoxin system toxin component, PIN family [Lyngbya sp.]
MIIDTNLWISFLIGQQLANLKELIVNQSIQVVLCEQIIEEVEEGVRRQESGDRINGLGIRAAPQLIVDTVQRWGFIPHKAV